MAKYVGKNRLQRRVVQNTDNVTITVFTGSTTVTTVVYNNGKVETTNDAPPVKGNN